MNRHYFPVRLASMKQASSGSHHGGDAAMFHTIARLRLAPPGAVKLYILCVAASPHACACASRAADIKRQGAPPMPPQKRRDVSARCHRSQKGELPAPLSLHGALMATSSDDLFDATRHDRENDGAVEVYTSIITLAAYTYIMPFIMLMSRRRAACEFICHASSDDEILESVC